jgi:hypothetical protein
MQPPVVALLAILVCGASAEAGTIISVSGVSEANTVLTDSGVEASSWTQTTTFQGVDISAMVSGPSTAIGTAYLTTSLGLGTTLADQIASTSFSFPRTPSYELLFSGLTLGPGTYYLSLTSTGGIAINEGSWTCNDGCNPSMATIVTAPGVTRNSDQFTEGNSIYPPAGTVFTGDHGVIYTVASVPEPASTTLIAMGLALLTIFSRYRRLPI